MTNQEGVNLMDKRVEDEIIEDEIIEDEIVEDEVEEEEEVEASEEEVEEESEDELEEENPTSVIEYEGVEYEVPETLKGAFMRDKDYTQKSQAISAERRTLEEDRKLFEEERKRDEEDFKLQAQLHSVEDQLKQYENVDWIQLEQSDPEAANSHWRQFQMMKERKNDLSGQVKERRTQRSEAAQNAISKRIQETETFAEKNIDGWGVDLANEIQAFALEQGFTQESFLTNLSPALLKSLHIGLQGQKIQSKVAKPAKKKSVVKPLKTVKAKSGTKTNRINLSEASMEDYYKARQKGIGG